MPMNPNFLCCIGAELKNSTQQTTRMSQVYLYRSFEDETLSDMLSAGFFNAAMGIIRQDDLLLLYSPNETTAKYTYARVSSVSSSGVVIEQIGIDATGISVDTTGYSNLSGNNLQEILNNLDTTLTTINNAFVRKDGSSVMTGPLKFRAGSFVGAIAGGLGDGISIYKLKSDDSIDSEVASLTKENGFTPGTTNAQDIGSSSLKWKDLYVARVITSVLNNGANISVPTTGGTMALTSDIKNSTVSVQLDGSAVDSFTLNQSSNKTINIPAANKNLSNLTSTGQNISNWSSNVTNCITKIPQDINLELNNGTLTLKAGSKVYVPNGNNVFDVYTVPNDLTTTPTGSSGTHGWFLIMLPNKTISRTVTTNLVYSGPTAPTANQYMFWYDTTNNLVKYTADYGSTWTSGYSLPIALISGTSGVESIDQVFNGFGYIGNSVFALPGTSGLVPNGRNADGTLKNTAWTTTQVIVRTFTSGGNFALFFDGNVFARTNSYSYLYKEQENINWDTAGNQRFTVTYLCLINMDASGHITYIGENRNVFHSVDYDDSDWVAHQALPSDRYIDMTLPASGGTIKAYTDGYIWLAKNSTTTGQRVKLQKNNVMATSSWSSGAENLEVILQVSKGDIVAVYYNADGTTNNFRFIYANGAK